MNRYMFGGIISRRTFTMFVSAIVFFVMLLGVGLGISAFATDGQIITAEVEVSDVPQSVLKIFDENYNFNGADFAGIKLTVTYPIGCAYNPDGTEDIVEEYVLEADDFISLKEGTLHPAEDETDSGSSSITAALMLDAETEFFLTIYDSPNSPLYFVHTAVRTKDSAGNYMSSEGTYVDWAPQLYMTSEEGFNEERDGQFVYLVGEDEVKIAKYIGSGGDITVPTTYKGLPVTTIMYHAFADTDKITGLTIPEGITTLEYEAVLLCNELKYITIPASAVEIGSNAISESRDSLEYIDVAEGNTAVCNKNGDGVLYRINASDSTKTLWIYPPKSTYTTYTIDDNVDWITGDAFKNAKNLSQIIMPTDENSSLSFIGAYAFYGSGITSVDVPADVWFVGPYAFANCPNLQSIEFGGDDSFGVLHNNVCCFDSNNPEGVVPSLENVEIKGAYAIGKEAFAGQTKLEDVTLSPTLLAILEGAFEGTIDKYLTINGYEGTLAELYCEDYGDTHYVRFNKLTGGSFISIPFTAAGSMGCYEGPSISIHADNGYGGGITTYGRENSDEFVYCCDFEDGTVLDITIGGNGYTKYTIEDFVVGEDTIPDDIIVYAGDINGDNDINITDIGMMVNKYALPVDYEDHPENQAYQYYDFNGDGYINITDIGRVVNNIENLYGAN